MTQEQEQRYIAVARAAQTLLNHRECPIFSPEAHQLQDALISLDPAKFERLHSFAVGIARLYFDGEERTGKPPADISNDETFSTLCGLIAEARRITGEYPLDLAKESCS
jgi:hypothetical protein